MVQDFSPNHHTVSEDLLVEVNPEATKYSGIQIKKCILCGNVWKLTGSPRINHIKFLVEG